MKKIIFLTLALALIAGAASAQSVVASKHDLRAIGGGTPIGTGLVQVCVTCHTPHQATTANAQDPLWNHTLSATNFATVYGSATMNAAPSPLGAAVAGSATTSHLCLSCHDGTISVLSMYKQPVLGGTPAAAALAGYTAGAMNNTLAAYIGTDLSDDHPVNFTFNAALATADGGLNSPASVTCVGVAVPCVIPLFPGTGALTQTVQCASCHNVHNPANVPFLRMDNTGSALCLACHIK